MKRKVNIRIIDKQTGRENTNLTYKFMKAINNYENMQLPEKFKITAG